MAPNNIFGIDLEANVLDTLEMQKNAIKHMAFMLEQADVKDEEVDSTPKEMVLKIDKMKLYHYKPIVKNVHSVPLLIVYALINRQYLVDLQKNRSLVRKMLEMGIDVYIIDWGYPTKEDMYTTMEDYIEEYINDAVDCVRERSKSDKINLLGICQGGTFSTIYTALHPEKIKNLITMVTPIDFSTNDGLLFRWGKNLDIDAMVDAYGLVPGDIFNQAYNSLKPFTLMLDKYVSMLDTAESTDKMNNFIRMERWINDSPDLAGEALRQFVKDLYRDNKLIKGEFELAGKKVNLKNITMPVFNIYAEQDHLVPPAASVALKKYIGSTDYEEMGMPVGHIGMYVSSKSQTTLTPKIVEWLKKHGK